MWKDNGNPLNPEGKPDMGIDLVAEDEKGNIWTIQVKEHIDSGEDVSKKEIDSFFAASESYSIPENRRLLMLFGCDLGKNSRKEIDESAKQPVLIYDYQVKDASLDWAPFLEGKAPNLGSIHQNPKGNYQREAVEAVTKGFETADKGKLVMACGTGKTWVSLRAMEKMAERTLEDGGKFLALYLAPSISLVSQTFRYFINEKAGRINPIIVCSDQKAKSGVDEDDVSPLSVGHPVTTDPEALVKDIKADLSLCGNSITVVFSTYQSLQTVIEAQNLGAPEFNLVIADEAHRTATDKSKKSKTSSTAKTDCSLIHQGLLKAQKTLFMTATPKVYMECEEAQKDDILRYSMDDKEKFGKDFYKYSFSKAIEEGVLSDYRIVVFKVPKHASKALRLEGEKDEKILTKEPDLPGKILGAFSSFYLNPENKKEYLGDKLVICSGEKQEKDEEDPTVKKAIIYTSSIKNSKWTADHFRQVLELEGANLPEDALGVEHVDGTMDSKKRNDRLSWLESDRGEKTKVLSNAKCLTEGIDVPALDSVIFFNPRKSQIDITQAVGRAIRKAEGKKMGYVLIPVVVDDPKNADDILDSSNYKVLWNVVQGLRSMDDRMDVAINVQQLQRDAMPKPKETGEIERDEDRSPRQNELPLGADPVMAALLNHCGSSMFWEHWAGDVAKIVKSVKAGIESLLQNDEALKELYQEFKKGMKGSLNRNEMKDSDLVDMLSQQVILAPIFEDLFENFKRNPMAKALEPITKALGKRLEIEKDPVLSDLWSNVRQVSSYLKKHPDPNAKESLIRNFYNDFFTEAFKKEKKKNGVVYTPSEIVDFMLFETNKLLKEEFGKDFSSENTQILDPFSGTGTFVARLIANKGLISGKALVAKYGAEEQGIWANEILLVPYYIMSLVVQNAYEARQKAEGLEPEASCFKGACFTDTFYSKEIAGTLVNDPRFENNSATVKAEARARINVIVSNPPYSSLNENDPYPEIDKEIRETYAKGVEGNNLNILYNSYIRALKWASKRLGNKGIISFVTPNTWITQKSFTGVRKSVVEEFNDIFVVNLRGKDIYSHLDEQGGEYIFSNREPIAITFLVKNPKQSSKGRIRYVQTKDNATKEEKLRQVLAWEEGIPWEEIKPDSHHDWFNQRSEGFKELIPVYKKDNKKFDPESGSIFTAMSAGLKTGNDWWLYNFSKDELLKNVAATIDFYNEERERWESAGRPKDAKDFVEKDETKIHWTRELLNNCTRNGKIEGANPGRIRTALYRPFVKTNLYYDPSLIEMTYQIPKLFPEGRKNKCILISEGNSSFSALMANQLPDLHLLPSSDQILPLYWYGEANKAGLLSGFDGEREREREKKDRRKPQSIETVQNCIQGCLHNSGRYLLLCLRNSKFRRVQEKMEGRLHTRSSAPPPL